MPGRLVFVFCTSTQVRVAAGRLEVAVVRENGDTVAASVVTQRQGGAR